MRYIFQKVLLNFVTYTICMPTEFALENILTRFLGRPVTDARFRFTTKDI